MFICSCFAVTDHQIRDEVKAGAKTFKQVQKKLKCSTNCGRCEDSAKEVFDKARAQCPEKG